MYLYIESILKALGISIIHVDDFFIAINIFCLVECCIYSTHNAWTNDLINGDVESVRFILFIFCFLFSQPHRGCAKTFYYCRSIEIYSYRLSVYRNTCIRYPI